MYLLVKNLIVLFLVVFNLSICFAQKSPKFDEDKEIKALIDSSRFFMNTSENDKSLENAKKALSLALKKNDIKNIAVAYNLIALNFSTVLDDDNAIKYFNKSIVYATKNNNDTLLSWVYNNLGNLYAFNKKDSENGIKYYLKAIDYSKNLSRNDYFNNVLNLANTYVEIKEFDKAIRLLNEVKPYLHEIEAEYQLTYFYYFLTAGYYEWRSFYYLAEENYLKAYQICIENPESFLKTHEIEISQIIHDFYMRHNSFNKAEKFSVLLDSLQKNLFDLEQKENILLLTQQIEKEEVKSELLKVEAEKRIQDQKLLNIKIFSILVFVIFLGTLLLLYYQFKLNKIKKVTNEELKIANEALQLAKEKAEEATLLKTQFVSTISHELRTPLYGVIGITDIIEVEHKELENSPHLKALKFSANYLLALVNDVLKIHKFEENSVILENNLFDIEEKLHIIKDSLMVIAKKQRNTIIIDMDPEIPQFVVGDSIRLSQIIINLVSNSLKFTTNGTVSIAAKLLSKELDVVYICFTVADNGLGIPLEYQDKIFDKFVQINRKEDDYQGTGLGLTIVKKLVTLFNGTISLKSQENVGTTVVFTIPLETGQNSEKKLANNIDVDLLTDTVLKILLVEDNKINQMVTKKLLENNKFICDVADDGFTAIEMLESTNYDAILMDINMPKINGFETTKLIRKKGINAPVIALTAFEKEEVYDTAIDAGINDVIAKPFDSQKLFQMIRNYTRNS